MLELLKAHGFVPRVAVWELTLACNLRCRHCGSRAGRRRAEELSLEEMLVVARDLMALGCQKVTLSGGEPLLRKDWPDLARVLTDGGVTVNMISNGQRFSDEEADRALDVGLKNIGFSLDGLEESHTSIRGVKDNWRRIISNFEICRRKGLKFGVITTVFRTNIDELESLDQLLRDEGAGAWQIQLATPSGNMDDARDLLIPPEAMLDLIPFLAELRSRPGLDIEVGDNIGYYGGYEEALRRPYDREVREEDINFWTGCNAGCQVIGIESNGNVKGCLSLPSSQNNVDEFVEGNLRERPLAEIWNDPDAFAYNRKFTVDQLEGYCRTCEWADICRGGCAWNAFAHSGSRYEAVYCYHRLLQERDRRESEPEGLSRGR